MKKLFTLLTAWYVAFLSMLPWHIPLAQAHTEPKPTEMSEFHWTPRALKLYAKQFMRMAYPEWNLSEHRALMKLWGKESAWNPAAIGNLNGTDRVYGIPQGKSEWLATQDGWSQVRWGLDYIGNRYYEPCLALQHWRTFNWY